MASGFNSHATNSFSASRKRKPVRHPRHGEIPQILGTQDALIAWRLSRQWRSDEIARVLNVSEAEVANSLHRLREMIHRGYKRRCILYPRHSNSARHPLRPEQREAVPVVQTGNPAGCLPPPILEVTCE